MAAVELRHRTTIILTLIARAHRCGTALWPNDQLLSANFNENLVGTKKLWEGNYRLSERFDPYSNLFRVPSGIANPNEKLVLRNLVVTPLDCVNLKANVRGSDQ